VTPPGAGSTLEVLGHTCQHDGSGVDVGIGEIGTHHRTRDAAHGSSEIKARIVWVRRRHDGAHARG
jgi:K+-sensing histidine kinase KdpD